MENLLGLDIFGRRVSAAMSVTQYFHIYEKSYSPIFIQPGCGVLSWLLTVILFGHGLQIFWKKIMTHISVWFLPKNTAPFLRKSWLLTQSYVIFPLHDVFSSDFFTNAIRILFSVGWPFFTPLSFWENAAHYMNLLWLNVFLWLVGGEGSSQK